MKHYSNPRLEAVFTDWPTGNTRTTATFAVETTNRGQRGTRVTLDPRTGQPNARKVLTYAVAVRIVDGDDGRTYFIERTMYGGISVMRSDMKLQEESIQQNDPRFAEVSALFGDAA